MKKILIILSFLNISVIVKAQTDSTNVRVISNQIKKNFASDSRSTYYDVQIKGDTVFAESTSKNALTALEEQTRIFGNFVKITALLPATNLNGLVYGLANLSVCNNRSAPQNSAEMMTQMTLGTPVEVLKKRGGYYLVKTPDQYLSWTDATAISLRNKAGLEEWKNAKRIIYKSEYGHAYSQADEKSARVSDLVAGNILVLTGTEKDFFKVEFPDKRIGFIKKIESEDFASWLKRGDPKAKSILTTAKTLIGVPYLWGGTSTKGVDCSGFTKTSYFLNGIIIPRDASQQALVGENIDVLQNDSISIEKCLKNLKSGDLLFFSAAKLKGIIGGRVTHTAIYMADGEFIQAAGMVRISSLKPEAANFDERESKTLVSAKRFLNHVGSDEITRVDQHEWYGK